MSDTSTNRGGIGFVGLLTILFIGLKLTDHVAWSWLWVLSPIWISIIIAIVIMVIIAVVMAILGD